MLDRLRPITLWSQASGFALLSLTFWSVFGIGRAWCFTAEESGHSLAAVEESSGAAIFQKSCSGCHLNNSIKAPTMETLKRMRPDYVLYALTEGKMAPQGLSMSVNEIMRVVRWLSKDQESVEDWVPTARCSDSSIDLANGPKVNDWGFGYSNHRKISQEDAGINGDTVSNLKLKWAVAFPYVTQMRSQPALVGNTLYVAVADATSLYALDADSGCVRWSFEAEAPPRTAVGYEVVEGNPIIWFGDVGGNVYVLDAQTGGEIWHKDVRLFTQSMVTGQPVLYQGVLYVPLSLYEIYTAAIDSYECCKGHGAIRAFDIKTGEELWTTRTNKPAEKTRISRVGTQLWGPSGSPVWNSPAIDVKRGLLYFGTGENLSDPASRTSDAIIALDLKTGEIHWVFQATEGDTYNSSCRDRLGLPNGPNCPENTGPDHDFGAAVMIVTIDQGSDAERDIVLAGQKSGTVWALDPDAQGKPLWKKTLSSGVPINGGIHWGMAYDGERLFVPISDASYRTDFVPKPALHALDPATGDLIWSHDIEQSCLVDSPLGEQDSDLVASETCYPHVGLSAPPTVAGDLVFIGALDGKFRAFKAKTGELEWEVNTNRSYKGINGIDGKGGAIDNNGVIVSNGRVYVQSGYGMHGQVPGNVLLQFALDEEPSNAGSVRLNNPVTNSLTYSDESVAKGYKIFLTRCTSCHGSDGKAKIDFVADATDLTNPARWRNGTSPKNMYRSIAEGAGYDMPPFKYSIPDSADIYHLMNWIVSTWSTEKRRQFLQEYEEN